MQLFIKYTPQAKPIKDGTENFYTPGHQLVTQDLGEITYRQLEGNVGLFTYSSTPKAEVMKLARGLSRFQTEILGQSEVEAIFDSVYTKDGDEYVIHEANPEAEIAEERLTVNTFDWVTITLPIQAYDSFEAMMTKVNNLFGGVERKVVGGNITLSQIESDEPMLSVFMSDEVSPGVTLYQAIIGAGGSVTNYTP